MRVLLGLLAFALTAIPATITPVDPAAYQKMVTAQKGKVVLVNFWATYCIPCRKEMPALVKLAEKYKAKGFVFVTVSADEPEDSARATNYLSMTKVPEPYYLRKGGDEAFIDAIDPKWSGALPASFLYDRTGKKVRAFFGEADLKALEAAIVKLLP